MKWADEAAQLYDRIVARVPAPHTQLVATTLRQGAEECAARGARPAVGEAEVVIGFFASTPKPLHPQIRANLGSLGIEFEKYLSEVEPRQRPTLGVDAILRDFASMCRGLGVPFDRHRVDIAMEAFADQFARSSVSMRTTTKSAERPNLAVRFLDLGHALEPDPLTIALQRKLTKDDGHPIYSLFSEAKQRCRAFGYGVDIEADGGFSKVWLAPSSGSDTLQTLASLRHLPAAVAGTLPHFERHGLATFGLIGFDFAHATINVYFMVRGATGPKDGYGGILRELGFATTPADVLEACRPASVMYYSFSWQSGAPRRLCFNVVCDTPDQVPLHFHPRFAECMNDEAFRHGQPRIIYGVAWATTDHYFKVENDYNGMMAAQLVAAGKVGVTPV